MNILDKYSKEQRWYKLPNPKNFKDWVKPIQENTGGIVKVPYWFEDTLNEFVDKEIKKQKILEFEKLIKSMKEQTLYPIDGSWWENKILKRIEELKE